jgi:hypothetical protein
MEISKASLSYWYLQIRYRFRSRISTVPGTVPYLKQLPVRTALSSIVWEIRDKHPGCLSRIPDLNFFHPGSRIQGQKYSWMRIRIKELKYLNPKNCF